VHEQALMRDLLRKIADVSAAEGGGRIVALRVVLGPLSHFTPERFREHFADAARGSCAEGAVVDAVVAPGRDGVEAAGVLLESVEIEEVR